MKKVSIKFNCNGKWAVTLTKQIEVEKGEVVNNLPVDFAHVVIDAGKGEIVEAVEEVKVKDDNGDDEIIKTNLFSYTELHNPIMKMKALQEIGEKLEVKDTKKSDLIEKILNAQVYVQDYLDNIDDVDLVELAAVKEIESVNEVDDMESLTDDETETLVKAILESQVETAE